MDNDTPTPEQAAQALNQIDRHQADAVHRAFWAPWWYKVSVVVLITGVGLGLDLVDRSWRGAVLWGFLLGSFGLTFLQRRHAGVRAPTFGPHQLSVRRLLVVAGMLAVLLGLPVLLGRLGVPLPHAIGCFAFSALSVLVGSRLAPREEAKRIAALSDPGTIEAAARETFASRHSTGRLWLIYLSVTLATTLLVNGLLVAALILGAHGHVLMILAVAAAIAVVGVGVLTMWWFQRPIKHPRDGDRS
jgi:hypothetical protein